MSYSISATFLYNLQKLALRIMFNFRKRESVIPVFTEMRILKFSDNDVYLTSRFMFWYHGELVPGIFHGYFIYSMDVHKYFTRLIFTYLLLRVNCQNLVFDSEGQ